MLILLASALVASTFYIPSDDCAADAFPALLWTPNEFVADSAVACVRAFISPRVDEGDLLWVNQPFTSHADPCLLAGITWSSANTSTTVGVVFRSATAVPLSSFTRCLQSLTYRNTAARPCPPFPWGGYSGDPYANTGTPSTGACDNPILPSSAYSPGRRGLYFATSAIASECADGAAVDALRAGIYGSNYIYAARGDASITPATRVGNCAGAP